MRDLLSKRDLNSDLRYYNSPESQKGEGNSQWMDSLGFFGSADLFFTLLVHLDLRDSALRRNKLVRSSAKDQFHAGPHKLSTGGLESMGKSNSKLKPEVVEELTRKTYCKCFLTTLLRMKVSLNNY